jgi:hypothetical protein
VRCPHKPLPIGAWCQAGGDHLPGRHREAALHAGRAAGLIQTGSWTIVSGAGAFEGLRGSGEMEVVYDPDDDSLAHVTFTGTVTR